MSNVPMIRFQGFTDDWIQCKLGDVAEATYGGGTPSTSNKDYWDGNIPWLQSSDITEHNITGVNLRKHITEEGLKNSATKLIPANSIAVVTRVGVGKLSIVPFQYTTSQDFLSMSNLNVDVWYGAYSLYRKLQKELHSVQGTSIKGITKDEFLSKFIFSPSATTEQTAIGNFFRTLDDTIHNHQQKLNCLRKLKKGYLQQMFPKDGESVPKVRFDGFTGDWQSVHLGDVVEKLKSYSLSRDVETNDVTGYRYIHYGDIHKQVADVITDDEQLPCIKIGDYIALKQGDLVLADASEDYIGIAKPCVILHKPQEHIIAGLHTIAIRPINTDSLFLYHLFHTDGFRKFGGFVGTGLKVFGITFSNVSKYEMKLPSFAEQSAIGGFFLNLDMQISSTITRIEQLKQLKAAYLQKMFI